MLRLTGPESHRVWAARATLLLVTILAATGVTCCAQSSVDLCIRKHDGDSALRVDRNATEILIANDVGFETYCIEGLEKLPRLKKLQLVLLPKIEDFSFLRRLKDLEILVIDSCGGFPGLPPLEWFPSMRHYVVSSLINIADNPSSYLFDLKSTPQLEYLQVTGCRLIALPTVINVPPSLKYVNFSQNEIWSVSGKTATLEALRTVEHVFLDFNHIPAAEVRAFPNVSLEGIFDILPVELMYTY